MARTPSINLRVPLRNEKARRIVRAVLENIENWESRALEIAEHATPGNKVRALSLARDMEMARLSLTRLTGMEDGQT